VSDPTDQTTFRTARYPRRTVLRGGLIGGLGIAGVALLGCGDDEGDEPAASAGTVSATQGASIAKTPDEFVVANEVEPADLFPWFGGFGHGLVTRQVYQTLVEPRLFVGAGGEIKWEVAGVLAESWEAVEPTRWRLKLRPGVTFHNGERWDAQAAKASFDLLSNAEIIKELKKSSLLAAVTSFKVVDDMTVEFTTAKPDPEVLTLNLRLGFVGLPPKLIAGDGWRSLREHPVGTGPYKFVSWSRCPITGLPMRRRSSGSGSSRGPRRACARSLYRPGRRTSRTTSARNRPRSSTTAPSAAASRPPRCA